MKRNIEIKSEKDIYACFTNTDLTEGRGSEYCHALAENQATAFRLAKGKNVQGANSKVQPCKIFYIKQEGESYGSWYAPANFVHLPTKEDLKEEKIIKDNLAKKILIEKFKKGEEISKEERVKILELLGEKP